MAKPNYAEFYDQQLVSLYDAFNNLGADFDFWLKKALELAPSSIIDLGCGTGLLTCALAENGYKVTGIEPSDAMLNIARKKPYADLVQWVEGGHEKLTGLHTDLLLMTSHVAQFFLEDRQWNALLLNAYNAISPGGHILFDSRNPLSRPWNNWTREQSSRSLNTLHGEVEQWYELDNVSDNRVRYNIHYLFLDSNETLTSHNELLYRSKEEIEQSLMKAGFQVRNMYGNWDGSRFNENSSEIIFLAQKYSQPTIK